MQVFSPRQSPNEFVFALSLSKTFIFMQVFSPRQSPNEFVFALSLSKTFIFMQVFSPRQSPNEFVSALGLSKTVIFGFIAAKIVQAAGNAKFRCSRGLPVPHMEVGGAFSPFSDSSLFSTGTWQLSVFRSVWQGPCAPIRKILLPLHFTSCSQACGPVMSPRFACSSRQTIRPI